MDVIAGTDAGKVRGRQDGAVVSFLNVPYAAPPFGANRYLAPAPVEPWDGVRDCVEYGPTALQAAVTFVGGIPEPVIAGEDCLNVNVFTPDLGASLPVLVWIHGGGFVAGCNASPWYRGEAFARDGVVLVSINYRLGIDGFLHLDGAPANRGILDCVAALEWVQANVAAFGGDPSQVTIAGQSAGGAACAILLSMQRARGLFQRVIAMSGAAHFAGTKRMAESVGARTAELLGVARSREAFVNVPDGHLLEAQAALGAVGAPAGGPIDIDAMTTRFSDSVMAFRPYVDGEVIPVEPRAAIRDGAGSSADVLVGTTSEEFNMVGSMLGDPADDVVLRALANLGIDAADAPAYRAHHGAVGGGAVIGRAITDRLFRVPAVRFGESRFASAGRTYAYEFRFGGAAGAAHCIDIPFAFDNLAAEDVPAMAGENPPQGLADVMHRAWVEFVTTGDPGWPAYEPQRRATMVFDAKSAVEDDPLQFEREIWRAI